MNGTKSKNTAPQPTPESAPSFFRQIGNKIVDNFIASLAAFVVAALIAGAGGMFVAMSLYWHAYVDIPPGLVIASLKVCSRLGSDWEPFEPAGGRFIVGAGPHGNEGVTGDPKNKNLDRYDVYSFPEEKVSKNGFKKPIGGEQAHTLTEPEMPKHNHAADQDFNRLVRLLDGSHAAQGNSAWDGIVQPPTKPNVALSKELQPAGGGQPHPNIPPYVALYYCQKM